MTLCLFQNWETNLLKALFKMITTAQSIDLSCSQLKREEKNRTKEQIAKLIVQCLCRCEEGRTVGVF